MFEPIVNAVLPAAASAMASSDDVLSVPETCNISPDGIVMPPSAVINPDDDIAPHVIAPVPNPKDAPVITPAAVIDAVAVAAFL